MWLFKNKKLEERLDRIEYKLQIQVQKTDIHNSVLTDMINAQPVTEDSKINTIKNLCDELESLKNLNIQLSQEHSEVKELSEDQARTIKKLTEDVQMLHYDLFQVKAENEIAVKRRNVELEEQKYKDFTGLYTQVMEQNTTAVQGAVDRLTERLHQLKAPVIIIDKEFVKAKEESTYKSI